MADTLIAALEYLGLAVVSLLGLFGLLGVTAFFSPRRRDPDDDYRLIVKTGKSPEDSTDSVNDNDAVEDRSGKVANRRSPK